MKLRRLALLALAVMIASLASATAGELLPHPPEADSATRSDATPCPDPGSDGAPCGRACPCSCCPGHVQTLAFAAERLLVAAPLASGLEPAPVSELHSKDLHPRVFHPPRT